MRKLQVQPQEDDSEIDMTPMLDVVFIMLIFFIVTASFVKEHGLDMNTPDQDEQQQTSTDNTILIRIADTGRIWVDDTPTEMSGVKSSVKRLKAQNPEANVVIQPDPKAKTDLMIRALDQARAAGADASISPLFSP